MNASIELTRLYEWLLNRSWQAGVLVLCVLLIQWLGRRSLTNRWRFALWWIVLARLLIPFGPASRLSLFNCFRPLQNTSILVHEFAAPAPVLTVMPTATSGIPNRSAQSIPMPVEATTIGVSAQSRAASLPTRANKYPARRLGPRMPETILTISIGCWLVGVLVLTGFVLGQVFRMMRRLSKTAVRANDRAYSLLWDCCRELRVRRRIELFETDAVKSPALFGLFRLRLLLPRGLAAEFDRSELRHVFLHELAHIRRGDLWINCLVTALQILHWFNPLLWLGFARLAADRELACDELALQHAGETAAEAYGLTVIKLLKGVQRPSAMPGLLGILEDRNQMRRRISRIARFKMPKRWSALAILLLAGLGLVALTDAQQERATRPNLTGTIETTGGKPIEGTVFIYTAGPRVGT
ncbi:MAG: M56 family metallopeptidase, partial [Limisphaerales bacterium]